MTITCGRGCEIDPHFIPVGGGSATSRLSTTNKPQEEAAHISKQRWRRWWRMLRRLHTWRERLTRRLLDSCMHSSKKVCVSRNENIRFFVI